MDGTLNVGSRGKEVELKNRDGAGHELGKGLPEGALSVVGELLIGDVRLLSGNDVGAKLGSVEKTIGLSEDVVEILVNRDSMRSFSWDAEDLVCRGDVWREC
jgi:hypothetical protein